VAVVQAAVDWKRSGIDRPIRWSELQRLLPVYLTRLGIHQPLSPERLKSGLTWALTPVASHVALISEDRYVRDEPDVEAHENTFRHNEEVGLHGEPGWVALDYIVSATDTPGIMHREIPDQTWSILIEMLAWPELYGVALVAHARGRVDVSKLILHTSMDELARSTSLGLSYEERGDNEEAEQIYVNAIDSGDPPRMSEGHAYLGTLLHRLGRRDEAVIHLRMVTDLSTVAGTVGTLILGVALQEEYSDPDGAEVAFSRVFEYGDRRLLDVAASRLAWLMLRRRDYAGAIEVCQRGLESGESDQAIPLRFFLALALRGEKRLREAEAEVVQAANRCSAEFGFHVWSLLGEIREELGDLRGAIRAYDNASTFEVPEEEPNE
jgi:tetratricopeptide (TPR) repeat protein